MDEQALRRVWQRPPSCPSDLDLDHLAGGVLAPEAAAELNDHVSGCVHCQESMQRRRDKLHAFPAVDPAKLLAAIQRRVDAAQKKPRPRRYSILLAPVFAAAAVVVLIVISKTNGVYQTRDKGALALHLYRLAEGRVEPLASGERVLPGDKLHFVVDLPHAGHVNILGIEASGKLYVAWPGRPEEPTLREAGKGQKLPGAMVADQSSGRETLYLALCPATVGAPASVCHADQATAPPLCPSGCDLTPFVLRK